MEVKNTFLVRFENGFRVIYETVDNRWFITTVNEPVLIIEISHERAEATIACTRLSF